MGGETNAESSPMRVTRREMIKRGAIIGGVAVWGVPLVKLAVQSDDAPTRLMLAAFPQTCETTPDVTSTGLVCNTTSSKAAAAFKATLKSFCTSKCAEAAGCAPATPSCVANKRTPYTLIGSVTCTETGNSFGCPANAGYVRNAKEFTCTAVVQCRCECR